MADITNELMYEVLKQLQDRLGAVDRKIDEVKGELQALRTHSMAMQQDTANIYNILVRHEARLGRIEQRLELAEAT